MEQSAVLGKVDQSARTLPEPRGDDRTPFEAGGAAGAAAGAAGASGRGGVGVAAGGAGGLEEGDGEEGAPAAAAGARAHLDGEAAPEAAVAGLGGVLELGDGVGVFVAEGLDRLVVAADVAAEADAVAFLVAVTGAEVGDLESDVDAVAEGEPVEMEGEGFGVEGEVVGGGHRSDCKTRVCGER
jgi:hypothetical protein